MVVLYMEMFLDGRHRSVAALPGFGQISSVTDQRSDPMVPAFPIVGKRLIGTEKVGYQLYVNRLGKGALAGDTKAASVNFNMLDDGSSILSGALV